jgi:hypothetical protein
MPVRGAPLKIEVLSENEPERGLVLAPWRTGSDRLDLSAPAEMCLLLGLS